MAGPQCAEYMLGSDFKIRDTGLKVQKFVNIAEVKWRSTISSVLMLLLYGAVLLHNAVPHAHQPDEHVTAPHQHADHSHDHHQEGESSSEGQNLPLDLSSLIAHSNLGSHHFGEFVGASFSLPLLFLPAILLASLCCQAFLRYKVPRPPDWRRDQRFCQSITSEVSRRGPPSFS